MNMDSILQFLAFFIAAGASSSTFQTSAEKGVLPAPDALPPLARRTGLRLLITALVGEIQFRYNKLRHRAATSNIIGRPLPYITHIRRLQYYVGRDDKGVLRGGSTHWHYVQNITNPFHSRERRFKDLCRMLAQLPANVTFGFKISPLEQDTEVIGAAFRAAGFYNEPRRTYLFTPDHGEGEQSLMTRIKHKTRTKINSAKRDLELTTMSIEEFFSYYRENLEAVAKKSHFFLSLDEGLMRSTENWDERPLEIIAARRKATGSEPAGPIEAAIMCSLGSDGFYKLMRMTYTPESEDEVAFKPHQHATKLLIFEAMKRSAQLGLVMDVDGVTPGNTAVYSRFGVFETMIHDEYMRKTASTLFSKYM